MEATFHIAALLAIVFAAFSWTPRGVLNYTLRVAYILLCAWAAVIVAMDYVQ